MAGIGRSEGGAQRFREEQRWPQGNTMLAKYSEVGRLAVNNNIYALPPFLFSLIFLYIERD